MKEGASVTAKNPLPIGRAVLSEISNHLLKDHSINATNMLLVYIMQFLSGGRAGESTLSSANSYSWDTILGNVFVTWNQQKTGRQDVSNYFNDFSNPCLDFYLVFAVYLMNGGGSVVITNIHVPSDANMVFPHLCNMKPENVAKTVTAGIQKLHSIQEIDEKKECPTGVSLFVFRAYLS